jgi:7,8-dihydroneopterin aldolase/epimerase/oxygenase
MQTPKARTPEAHKLGQSAAAQKSGQPRRVFVRDLELIGSLGVYEHEKRYQQRIIISIDLDVLDDYDGLSDQIHNVYDYDHAIGTARAAVSAGHTNLNETLAERIAEGCLADARVLKVRVTVEKPDVLPGCRAVGIEIERVRRK